MTVEVSKQTLDDVYQRVVWIERSERQKNRVIAALSSALVVAVALVVILAASVTTSIENKRAEDTCRSRIAGEVTAGQADVTLAIGAGLEAVARKDDEALAVAFDDLDGARTRLDEAVAARERSEETCDQR